jgi:hypothetical protein
MLGFVGCTGICWAVDAFGKLASQQSYRVRIELRICGFASASVASSPPLFISAGTACLLPPPLGHRLPAAGRWFRRLSAPTPLHRASSNIEDLQTQSQGFSEIE